MAIIDDEGYITVVDRKKDMIKTGGENVASRGVEEALYRLPGVSEVALGGLPHPRWIEAVTAIVVCKPGQVLTETQVIEHCAGQLARFMTPKAVLFTDSLPKNPSDKLLKRKLRLRFERHFTCRQRVVIGLCRKSRRRNLIRTYASRPLSPPTYRGSTIKHRGGHGFPVKPMPSNKLGLLHLDLRAPNTHKRKQLLI